MDGSKSKKLLQKSSKNSREHTTTPIKKCHFLDGKHFVVIDNSIKKKLKFFTPDNMDLYFEQTVSKDDCIVLRPLQMSKDGEI